jgi:hypothetical protein
MSTAAVGSANSLLNTYDPLNPSSALTTTTAAATTTPATTAPATSTAATTSIDPINNSTPAGFDVLNPVPNAAPAGPSTYQQALDSFTVTADTFLIQSALNGQQQLSSSAAFGSPSAQLASLGNTIDVLKNASLSGNYGSRDSVV